MAASRHDSRRGHVGLIVMLGLFVSVMTLAHALRAWSDRPDQPQRIAAVLISWGLSPDGLRLPVEPREIEQRIELLRSSDSEERVRAAQWLASHGVRDAAEAIALAMDDPGTLRPCQLAHSLGHLGDERWVDELVRAANQPRNRDLQVCATIGLKSLASDRAVDALIDLARGGTARTTAIEALGIIGDEAAAPHLRDIAQSTLDVREQRIAEIALGRIEILNVDDPIPALEERLRLSLREGYIDEWALRWLARKGDGRAVGVLASGLMEDRLSARGREHIAATLLVHGEEGIRALERVASSTSRAREVSRAALSLVLYRSEDRVAFLGESGRESGAD